MLRPYLCYTGQLAQAELGLDYYVARYYDPLTAHFTQADTLIPEPGKASSFDRYAYARNNPVRYNDPSGHKDSGECGPGEDCDKKERKPYTPIIPKTNDKKCHNSRQCDKEDRGRVRSILTAPHSRQYN